MRKPTTSSLDSEPETLTLTNGTLALSICSLFSSELNYDKAQRILDEDPSEVADLGIEEYDRVRKDLLILRQVYQKFRVRLRSGLGRARGRVHVRFGLGFSLELYLVLL